MSVMKKKMKFCPDLVFFLTFSKLHDSTVGSVFILCCRSVALRTPPTVLLPTVEPGATLFGYIINCKVSCWRRVCSPTRYWEISKMECLTVASCAVAVYNAFFAWQRWPSPYEVSSCNGSGPRFIITALHRAPPLSPGSRHQQRPEDVKQALLCLTRTK